MIFSSDITARMGGQTGFLLDMPRLNVDVLDKNGKFKRSRNWLRRTVWTIETVENADPVLKKFSAKLEKQNRTKTKTYAQGLDLH